MTVLVRPYGSNYSNQSGYLAFKENVMLIECLIVHRQWGLSYRKIDPTVDTREQIDLIWSQGFRILRYRYRTQGPF